MEDNCMSLKFPFPIFVLLIIVFLVTALSYDLFGNFRINLVIGFLFSIIVLFYLMFHCNLLRFIFTYLTFILFSLCSIILIISKNDDFIFNGIRDSFLFLFTCLLLICVQDKKFIRNLITSFQKYSITLFTFLILLDFFLLLCLFLDNCYEDVWAWKGRYFCGFSYSPHALASAICLLSSLKLLCLRNFKLHSLLLLIPFLFDYFLILQTGARVFVIPALLILFLYLYYSLHSKNKLMTVLTSIFCTMCLVVITLNSNFSSKMKALDTSGVFQDSSTNPIVLINPNIEIQESNNSSNKIIDSLSSGRLLFAKKNLEAFVESDILNILFGNGFNFAYLVSSQYRSSIWAHNDFVSVLISGGFLGLGVYLIVLLNVFLTFKVKSSLLLSLIIYVCFPALLNGFYMYQTFLFSFVILYLFIYSLSNPKKYIVKTRAFYNLTSVK